MGCTSCKDNTSNIEKLTKGKVKNNNIFFRLLFYLIALTLLPIIFLITAIYLFKIMVLNSGSISIIDDALKFNKWLKERKQRKEDIEMNSEMDSEIDELELEDYEEIVIDEQKH